MRATQTRVELCARIQHYLPKFAALSSAAKFVRQKVRQELTGEVPENDWI
jgi:hypothetical protein